jgi:hypothetical protein
LSRGHPYFVLNKSVFVLSIISRWGEFKQSGTKHDPHGRLGLPVAPVTHRKAPTGYPREEDFD